eukprot:gene11006-11993_t
MMATFDQTVTYRNQPLTILAESVNVERLLASEAEREWEYLNILSIVRKILHDNEVWSHVQRDQVKIKALLGGITNQLLLIEKLDARNSSEKLVFRLFGQVTVEFIHRTMENIVFARLSEMGFGPTFYGVFENGRIEGFLPGTNLTPEEMTPEPVNLHIASAVAQLHSFQFPVVHHLSSLTFDELNSTNFSNLLNSSTFQSSSNQWLWNKLELFFHLAKDLTFPTTIQQEKYDKLSLSSIYEEFHWFKNTTNRLHQKHLSWQSNPSDQRIPADRVLGRLFALEEVLCHNDLLSGNIMLVSKEIDGVVVEGEKLVKLIDYEYGAYNYRGYDIANHFYECCGFDCNFARYPNKEKRHAFYTSYLTTANPSYFSNEQFLEGFDDIVLYFTLISNFFWGTWSIVQAKASTIDFDYLGYASLRYDAYFEQKKLFYDESKFEL